MELRVGQEKRGGKFIHEAEETAQIDVGHALGYRHLGVSEFL